MSNPNGDKQLNCIMIVEKEKGKGEVSKQFNGGTQLFGVEGAGSYQIIDDNCIMDMKVEDTILLANDQGDDVLRINKTGEIQHIKAQDKKRLIEAQPGKEVDIEQVKKELVKSGIAEENVVSITPYLAGFNSKVIPINKKDKDKDKDSGKDHDEIA